MSAFSDCFRDTLVVLGIPRATVARLWSDLSRSYSASSRHYHSLAHLDSLHLGLEPITHLLIDRNAVVLAIAYHDAVYNVKRSDNEERSAELARKTLGPLGLDRALIDHSASMVLATKTHVLSDDPDTNLFTDADLSILGAPPEAYARYAEQVRKEYGIYPDFLYKPGRRKVLEHFLAMDRIFKTDWFNGLYGVQARTNLQGELDRG